MGQHNMTLKTAHIRGETGCSYFRAPIPCPAQGARDIMSGHIRVNVCGLSDLPGQTDCSETFLLTTLALPEEMRVGWSGVQDVTPAPMQKTHQAGCLCCLPRPVLPMKLLLLFQERGRGNVAFFQQVLIVTSETLQNRIRRELENSPLVSGLYKLS